MPRKPSPSTIRRKQEAFAKEMVSNLSSIGKIHNAARLIKYEPPSDDLFNYSRWEWEVDTLAGVLKVSFDDDPKSEVYTVFCRYNDVEAAKPVCAKLSHPSLNPHSGKWNFHFGLTDGKPKDVATHIILTIRKVMK